MRFSICPLPAGLVLCWVSPRAALALTGEQYLPQAKVTLTEARKIALEAYPGNIVTEEIEKEGGDSGLRYSFKISHGKAEHEVGIDAMTGKVLENSVESSDSD